MDHVTRDHHTARDQGPPGDRRPDRLDRAQCSTGTAASHSAQWEAQLMNRPGDTRFQPRCQLSLFAPYICWPWINTAAHKTGNDTSNLCACVGQLFFTVAHFLRHVASNKDLLQCGCQFFGVIDHWQASHNAAGRCGAAQCGPARSPICWFLSRWPRTKAQKCTTMVAPSV